MKKNKGYKIVQAVLYSIVAAGLGMGVPLGLSFLFFGLSGINENMVIANNILMGIVGAPIIIILTRKYYLKHFPELIGEVDFFTRKGLKKSSLGLLLGIILPLILVAIMYGLGGKIVYQGTVSISSIVSGVLTFLGMAVLEECIFRGILKTAFLKYGTIVSLVVPAVLFAAFHVDVWLNFDLLRLIELLLAGILYGTILLKTKSLTTTVIAHAVYNIMITELFGIGLESAPLQTTDPLQVFGFSGETVVTIFFIVAQILFIFAVVFWGKINKRVANRNE